MIKETMGAVDVDKNDLISFHEFCSYVNAIIDYLEALTGKKKGKYY